MVHMIVRFLFYDSPRRFFLALVGFVAAFFVCTTAIAIALEARGLLPPPPLSYTNCIDEKLTFLHELPPEKLENANILAVGSSATWRNLDFNAWLEVQPDANPINIAPCYLHIDQIAYFARAMLKHTPNIETLLTVVHPRDFEECRPDYRQFVSEQGIKAYIFEKQSMTLKYLTNFRTGLVRDLVTILTQPEYTALVEMDRFGSGPLTQRPPNPYRPDFVVDPDCKPFVTELEDAAADAGTRLVLVFLPIMEGWADEVDPDRSKHRALRAWITDRLKRESTLVLDANTLELPDEAFVDPVHLWWQYTPTLTQFIAEATTDARNVSQAELQK